MFSAWFKCFNYVFSAANVERSGIIIVNDELKRCGRK
jgi:hypothetical protein